LVAVQDLIAKLNREEDRLAGILAFLRDHRELDRGQFRGVQSGFAAVQDALRDAWTTARDLSIPALAHMNDDTSVQEFVLPELPDLVWAGDSLDGRNIQKLVQLFGQALGRLRKLHFKNLGALLHLQEQLDPSLYPTDR